MLPGSAFWKCDDSMDDTGPTERPSTPDSRCPICLSEFTNSCHTDSCLHSFCFECLKRWSNSAKLCPLCKEPFNHIYHSFGDLGVHETYDVSSIRLRPQPLLPIIYDFHIEESGSQQYMRTMQRLENLATVLDSDYGLSLIEHTPISGAPIIGVEMRTLVYINHTWAEPLPDSNGRFLDCSLDFHR